MQFVDTMYSNSIGSPYVTLPVIFCWLQIQFVGMCGDGSKGDIAIDDIKVVTGDCGK